jgi:condensin-2 complex subunit D3
MLQRCLDSKAAVRKAALVLMKKSASLLGRPPDGDIVEAMGAACGDTMVSIRKSALAASQTLCQLSHSLLEPLF